MFNCTECKEPPYAERHVRWCERSENESRKKTTSFSSYSIKKEKDGKYINPAILLNLIKQTSMSNMFAENTANPET